MTDQPENSTPDYGYAISYEVLAPGTPVVSADGVQLGTVTSTSVAKRDRIFDGIHLDTPAGHRFLDAPECERIYERAVVTTFTAAERDTYLHDTRR